MNMREYFTEDGIIVSTKGRIVNICNFVEEYSNWLWDNDRRFKGSFYELSDEEIKAHYDRVIFEV